MQAISSACSNHCIVSTFGNRRAIIYFCSVHINSRLYMASRQDTLLQRITREMQREANRCKEMQKRCKRDASKWDFLSVTFVGNSSSRSMGLQPLVQRTVGKMKVSSLAHHDIAGEIESWQIKAEPTWSPQRSFTVYNTIPCSAFPETYF